MARYLVTGAAGFIARRVIEQLIAQGHEVVGVDNLNDSYDPRLKEWRLQQLARLPGFRFFRDDICGRIYIIPGGDPPSGSSGCTAGG